MVEGHPMKFLLPVLFITLLTSCGPAAKIKKRAPLFSKEEKLVVLSEKADKEVIISKYKNKINLRCDFMIDNNPKTNVTYLSGAGFTVNLAMSEAPTNLVFKMLNGQVFTAGVRVKKFDILPELILPHESGTTYVMKQTPVVELVIRGRDVHGKKDKRYEKTIVAHENLAVTLTDLFPKKYPHFLKCELQTIIPEGYKDQYQIIPPTKEETRVEMNPETVVTPSPETVSEENPTMEVNTGPNP
jgi:hypothetical protein